MFSENFENLRGAAKKIKKARLFPEKFQNWREGESLSLFLLVCSRWTTVTTGLLLQPLRQGLYWRPPIQTNAYQCIPICINMLLLLYNQLYI